MPWSSHNKRAAQYNQHANKMLLDACGSLTAESVLQDRGVFFDSIIGTWNHFLVTDLLWLQKLQKVNKSLTAIDQLPKLISTNQVIAAQINEVIDLRTEVDHALIDWINHLNNDDHNKIVKYTTLNGDQREQPLGLILQHIFNHQTHHRGQITALLSQAGVSYGCIDLIEQQYDVATGASG